MAIGYIAVCSLLLLACTAIGSTSALGDAVEISSVRELAEYAAKSGNNVRMKPGVYRMSDYLGERELAEIRREVPAGPGRPQSGRALVP